MKRMMYLAFLVAFALIPLANAQTLQGTTRRSTGLEKLEKEVRHELVMLPYYTRFDDIEYKVEGDKVTLSGWVTRPTLKSDAENVLKQVEGIETIVNRIEVLPVSQFDDDLRYVIARAIYGNPHFLGYGSMVNPPIHIIVDRGRVTLEGVVNSNVERMLARSIATSFNAFEVKNELKTDAEVKEQLEKL